MAKTPRYSSIQLTKPAKDTLDRMKKKGESFEDVLRRKRVIR